MMMTELKKLYVGSLRLTAGCRKLGIGLMRVAIFVIFVWIGGLKFWNYEAEGLSLIHIWTAMSGKNSFPCRIRSISPKSAGKTGKGCAALTGIWRKAG